ncbi:MAG: hypothetical protein C6Y22_14185 [Hapalosiphonaceae cyanobacterium JJU2]|nr:MAG: hypothetical protein C6Y22_14185 [Hapalosiphonaceae cyanobacterium JJU2]
MIKPILQKSGNRLDTDGHSPEQWLVVVYPHPVMKNHYSYGISIAGKPVKNPVPLGDNPHLFGCYGTPQEALSAGIEEAQH